MDVYHFILRLIDLRSFSSLWYWIALIAVWIWSDRWVLSIPADLIFRARKQGVDGQATQDVERLTEIYARRALELHHQRNVWRMAWQWALATCITLLAVVYRVELAQGVLLLVGPWWLTRYFGQRLAVKLAQVELLALDVPRILMWHRFKMQMIGMLAIFVTVLFGLIHNVT